MTSSLNGMPGPTSRHYFSQRLRLHYVDWGNPEAPPLLLVHGGRDHCRNWDWVAQALRDDWHVICPDLRGHGDSQWSPDGNYAMSSYIYDLDQLIHQQGAGAGDHRCPFAGRQHLPALLRHLSRQGAQAGRHRGAGPVAQGDRRAPREDHGRAHARMGRRAAQALGPPAAPLPHHRGRLQAHAGGERASLGRAGAAPDGAGRQPERGRHLQLEVRQLRARLAALRHELPRHRGAVVARSPARRCWSTARRAGPPIRRRTAA